ncbi:thioesterase-like superfamily-domain-containing protein [Aspergillus karnatakaensis]|uniref:acyl-CoA thioesterase n=1 Tax=Aspergillus karnatakaensis TaxID=1810916 RepID=UPI003CCDBF2E
MPAIAPLEPPSFVQALHLEKLPAADERYMSTFPALSYDYAPGQPLSTSRSYGGHAFAQAIWAASLGIRDSGLRIHEANGYWTVAGYANRPFIYEVKTLSLTRSFALREVIARQPTTPSDECPFPKSDGDKELGPVAFALTCSFKQRETGPGYWLHFNGKKYGDILQKDPNSHPQHVYFNGPNGAASIKLADFPSIDIRTPDLQAYTAQNPGTAHRRLHVYRASEQLDLDPNLMAGLHAYVSDRAGLSVLLHAFGTSDLGISGSLSHKIIFHVSPEEMVLSEKSWFVQEMSSSRGGEGRGVIDSRIWSPSGELVVTTIQDALFRQPKAKLV